MRKLDPKKHPKLIAFLEKTQKVLKTVAVICFSLVMVLCVFFYTKACADKNTVQLINASAEEASTVADVESGLDLTQYPSANLIQLLDKKATVNGSVVVSTSFEGKVTVKGTATSNGGRLSYFSEPIYLSAGTYSWNNFVASDDVYPFMKLTSLSDENFYYEFNTFTVSEERAGFYNLGFSFGNGRFYDLEFYPMLNVGDTLLPFIPNLNAIYNGGYNAGYEAGETDGYNEGLAASQRGFFNNCKVSCLYWSGSEWITYDSVPVLTDFGIDLTYLYDYFSTITFPDLFSFTLILHFYPYVDSSVFWNSSLRCTGSSTLFNTENLRVRTYYGLSRGEIPVTFEKNSDYNSYTLTVNSSDLPDYEYSVASIGGFNFENISVFKNLRFYLANSSYSAGYDIGFQAGYNDNGAYDDGYDKGYTAGKSDGFQEGFNQRESGGFGWLISSVQAFLNAPFFGNFSVGTLLYVGLGMTLTTLFLKMFAGG